MSLGTLSLKYLRGVQIGKATSESDGQIFGSGETLIRKSSVQRQRLNENTDDADEEEQLSKKDGERHPGKYGYLRSK